MNKRVNEYREAVNKLLQESGPAKKVEIGPNWYTNHLREQAEAETHARNLEEKRIKNLKCPVCQSTSKSFHSTGSSNGIFGPGYHYSETDSYWVCNKCGVMYKDLNKQKNKNV
jgi:rubredoxin